jgi:RNA polymerase sigma-70 factor (ECF subfamily)
MEDSDSALVRALQDGDDRAFDELLKRHTDAVYRFVRRYVESDADAEDLTQEAFVRAYFRVRDFSSRAKFVTWLFRIAHNLCIDFLRRRRFLSDRMAFSVDEPDRSKRTARLQSTMASPAQELTKREKLAAVDRAIQQLPVNLRIPLVLVALEGFSYEAAAAVLQISSKAVEMRLYRARKVLLKQLAALDF